MNDLRQTAFKKEGDVVELPVLLGQQHTHTPFLELPTDFPRSPTTSCRIDHVSFSLSASCCNSLKQLGTQAGTSLCTTLLSIYYTLLFRYTRQEDIVIGFPALENVFNEKGELIGIHQNTKKIRTDLSGNPSFNELLKLVHQVIFTTDKHEEKLYETPDEITKLDPGINKAGSHNVVFSYKDPEFGNNEINCSPNIIQPENYKGAFDLALDVEETTQGLNGMWKYNSELFQANTINRLAKHFEVLLEDVISNPLQTISQLHVLTDKEHRQLTLEWNSSKINYPADRCIHELFEEQARKTPEAVALIFENKKLTYKELNDHSNQLAHYLKSKGVKQETLVPICVGRSLEMIIGTLGILKAGGAYVPIDPGYPQERIAFLLADTSASLVVCNKESKIQWEVFENIDFVELTYEGAFLKDQPTCNLNIELSPGSLAYVIYTSGSTGKPKGVMIEHRSLADHCYGIIESAGLKTCESFALFSPLVFDAGQSIIHSSFILGASLHVLSDELILNGEKLMSYLGNHSIDCIKIVPSLWLSYANLKHLVLPKKVIIFGGEAFHLSILNYLIKSNYSGNVYNHYGPTEATVGKCIYKVNLDKTYHTVPIGKPFSNTRLYILDDYYQLTPVGVEGELYIAGEGLARGYLNQANLTGERFVLNPFTVNASDKMYKTGDKVRWLSDGNIEYIGRADDQVKIQGHRIELGEIEEALLESELVRQVVVLANADKKGNKRLVAYIVPDKPFDKKVMTAFLRKKLPEYMIPVTLVEVENLALTVNGKINKKELENLEEVNRKYIAPQNDVEAKLAAIWKDVLNIERIGIHDDFFELGGNSIQAVALFARIKKKFRKDFPLAFMFKARTINQFALALKETKEALSLSSSLVPIQPNGSRTPIFLVHAGHGNILFYGSLCQHMGMDQPCYGLQAKGINGTELPFSRIEQMASYYIEEIRRVQPEGPYNLVGYCLGALIIFEMAQQLTSQGQEIALLASFNGVSPIYYRPSNIINIERTGTSRTRFARASYHLKNIAKLSSKEKIIYIFKRFIIQLLSKLKGPFVWLLFKLWATIVNLHFICKRKAPQTIARKHLIHSLFTLGSYYKPKPYSGPMVIFRSPGIFTDPYLGWKSFVKGEIKTFDIPGMHKTRRDILNEPFVQFLAKEIKNHLDNQPVPTIPKKSTGIKFIDEPGAQKILVKLGKS
ncbi:MAG TPA: amino acid adenylation domain-containing protein [Mucilaginibacter sp.]|jgi:amino acid adenylation domain-containing protein